MVLMVSPRRRSPLAPGLAALLAISLLSATLPVQAAWQAPAFLSKITSWRPGKAAPNQLANAPITLHKALELNATAIVGSPFKNPKQNDPAVKDLIGTLNALNQAANNHQLEAYLRYYAPRYVSGDNLSRDQVRAMVEESWKLYPNMAYNTKVLEIRMNGPWATVETVDKTQATGIPSPLSLKEGQSTPATALQAPPAPTGEMRTQARSLTFLHRVGQQWLVEGDHTLYESAWVAFGHWRSPIQVDLFAPEQVNGGEGYSAKVLMGFPNDVLAMASINQEPLVYPHPKVQESYRMVGGASQVLERVFEANTNQRNELVSASFGILENVPRQFAKNAKGQLVPVSFSIELTGLLTVVRRVNVVPKAGVVGTAGPSAKAALNQLVKTSANGVVDLTKEPPAKEGDKALGVPPVTTP